MIHLKKEVVCRDFQSVLGSAGCAQGVQGQESSFPQAVTECNQSTSALPISRNDNTVPTDSSTISGETEAVGTSDMTLSPPRTLRRSTPVVKLSL